MRSSEWFRWFAVNEAADSSATYERLSLALADDDRLMAMVDSLPSAKRQPNLLFAVAQLLEAPTEETSAFLNFIERRWEQVSAEMKLRSTQTNEAARCAAFLPLLAQEQKPISLIEVGCAAGLCLYPDRYSISYNGRPSLVESSCQIEVAATGALPYPVRLPRIAARIGIDLNPLDVQDPDDLAWLDACIWPEHQDRRDRLGRSAALVAQDPPRFVTGDLVDELEAVLAAIDPETVPVVFHTAVLAYVDQRGRRDFADILHQHPEARWLANESRWVIDAAESPTLDLPHELGSSGFLLVENGIRVHAQCEPHGRWINWLEPPIAGRQLRPESTKTGKH